MIWQCVYEDCPVKKWLNYKRKNLINAILWNISVSLIHYFHICKAGFKRGGGYVWYPISRCRSFSNGCIKSVYHCYLFPYVRMFSIIVGFVGDPGQNRFVVSLAYRIWRLNRTILLTRSTKNQDLVSKQVVLNDGISLWYLSNTFKISLRVWQLMQGN